MKSRHAVAACAIIAAATTAVVAATDDEPSAIKTREITKLSPRAAVVLDRNCPTVVQPYRLADNAATLGLFGAGEKAKELMRDAGTALKGLFGGDKASGTTAPASQVEASTRQAAKQLNWLPMTAEVAFGERMHQEYGDLVLDRDSRLGKKHYPQADALLAEVLAGVGESTEYRFRVHILKNSTRNAVARPGGFIYLDQGLLETPAQLPKAHFALAHEIAHVLQRHETKELQSFAIDSLTVKEDLTKVIAATQANPDAVMAKVRLEKNQFTRHHIDQELQADSCAARILGRALPDEKALATSLNAFIVDLPKESPADVAPRAALPAATAVKNPDAYVASIDDLVTSPIARHPTSAERVGNLRSIYGELAARPGGAKK